MAFALGFCFAKELYFLVKEIKSTITYVLDKIYFYVFYIKTLVLNCDINRIDPDESYLF